MTDSAQEPKDQQERAAHERSERAKRELQRLFEGEVPGGDIAAAYPLLLERVRNVLRKRHCNDVEDCACETILRYAQSASREVKVENPVGYLIQIARNVWSERLDKKIRERSALQNIKTDVQASEEDGKQPGFEARIIHKEWLRWILKRMRRKDRVLLHKYYMAETSEARQELADSMQITLGKLKTDVHRIRKRLLDSLGDCGKTEY